MLHRTNTSLIQLLSYIIKHPKAVGYTSNIMLPKNLYFSFYLVLVTGRQFVPRFWVIFLVPAIERNARCERILTLSSKFKKKKFIYVLWLLGHGVTHPSKFPQKKAPSLSAVSKHHGKQRDLQIKEGSTHLMSGDTGSRP